MLVIDSNGVYWFSSKTGNYFIWKNSARVCEM